MNIYTPTYGNTTPIQGLNSLDTALSQITGASTPQVQQAYSAAQGGALQMQGGENQYANQQQQQATQQLVNPLYSQMGNIGQMFQLYLADQGLAQKYQNITGGTGSVSPYQDPALLASAQAGGQQLGAQNAADIAQVSQMTTPQQAGSTLAAPAQTTGQAPNPYLASPSDIIASAANAPQAPGVTTAEMAQPISGGMDMLSLLNSLIGQQQGVAKDVTTQNVAQYQDKANVLQSLANLLGGELSNRATLTQPGSEAYKAALESSVQEDAKNTTLNDLIKKYRDVADPTQIWQIYNQVHQSDVAGTKGSTGWGPATESPQQLATMGVTVPSWYEKLYQTQTDQLQSAQNLVSNAQQISDEYNKIPYAERVIMDKIPGMSHLVGPLAGAKSLIFNSLSELRKNAVGGRITQAEIQWLTNNTLPSASDSSDVISEKLKILQDQLNKKINNPNYIIGVGKNAGVTGGGTASTKGGSNSDPLGIR